MTNFELLKLLVENKTDNKERIQKELELLSEAPDFIVEGFLRAYQIIYIDKTEAPQPINECHSEIAYQLGITTMAPGKISCHYPVKPSSLPDYDCDFADNHKARQYVIDKYGAEYVCGITTYGKYKFKSLLKALAGLGKDTEGERLITAKELNVFTKKLGLKIDSEIKTDDDSEDDEEIEFENEHILAFQKAYPWVFTHFKRLLGLPKYGGAHPGGTLILPQKLLDTLPLRRGNNGFVTEWQEGQGVTELGSVGAIKIDLLGLLTLNILQLANELIVKRYNLDENSPSPCSCKEEGIECETNYKLPFMIRKNPEGETIKIIDLDKLCLNIKPIYQAICEGKTEGIFQFEPRGITEFAKSYAPTKFSDLYYITSLYRPGAMDCHLDKNGMPIDEDLHKEAYAKAKGAHVHFVERKHGRESVSYPAVQLRKILEPSQGIAVFQEDISRIIMEMTGCGFGDAEAIRKYFTKVKPELLRTDPDTIAYVKEMEVKFIADSVAHGASQTAAEAAWNTILPFARYGFGKCLSGDTIIERPGANNIHPNPKITIKEMYDAQESKTDWGKKIRNGYSSLLQMDNDNIIRPGKLKKIHYSGKQCVYKISTENGNFIKGTINHKLLTNTGYKEIGSLIVGDMLISKSSREPYKKVESVIFKYSPPKSIKYRGGFKKGEDNPSYRDGRTISFTKVKDIVLNRSKSYCEKCGKFCFENTKTKKYYELAHLLLLKEVNYDVQKYNHEGNILLLCLSCHRKLDYSLGVRKKRWSRGYKTFSNKIVSIEKSGIEDTYDIEMNTTEHNFVANGIVSHNSHAVAYSLISYQTAFFRTLYPLEYFTSLLTYNIEKEEKVIDYIRIAQKNAIEVRKPHINDSGVAFSIDSNNAILAGLEILKGVGEKAASLIIANRDEVGPFISIEDFLTRKIPWKNVNIRVLKALVYGGCFDDIASNRALALAKINIDKGVQKKSDYQTTDIFDDDEEVSDRKRVYKGELLVPDWDEDTKFIFEREVFGFPFDDPMFKYLDGVKLYFDKFREVAASKGKSATFGIIKDIYAKVDKNGNEMAFLTVADLAGNRQKWTLFSTIYGQFKKILHKNEAYFAYGRFDEKYNSYTLDGLETVSKFINMFKTNKQ